MITLITGATGLLGGALLERPELRWTEAWPHRLEQFIEPVNKYEIAILCAGTKGFAACEGNAAAFRADVDGNIWLARKLLAQQTFVVFVSTDAVEVAAGSAYARNRLLVEMALNQNERVAIFRPGRFDKTNVNSTAIACALVAVKRKGGLYKWP